MLVWHVEAAPAATEKEVEDGKYKNKKIIYMYVVCTTNKQEIYCFGQTQQRTTSI